MKSNVTSVLKGSLLASAVAGLFIAVAPSVHAGDTNTATTGDVKCEGINACKAQGGCATADHDCHGKNACKGKGWVKVKTEKECTDQGGKVKK